MKKQTAKKSPQKKIVKKKPVQKPVVIDAKHLPVERFDTAYSINVDAIKNTKQLRIAFVFAAPEHLVGTEAFHFTLNHQQAGQFARMVEKTRKQIA